MGIRLEVWGPYALFSRPELKTERVSYDVMTPSAARGLLDAIFWHPGLHWVVDSIRVLNPIRFANIRRNEVKSKADGKKVQSMMIGGAQATLNTRREIMQRASMVLTDVRYVITAHFDMTEKAAPIDTPEKFYAIACRRMRAGQNYHTPCFGCREFPASYRLLEEVEPLPETETSRGLNRDLGLMLYDLDYSNPRGGIPPMFFHAELVHGDMNCREVTIFR